MCIVGTFRYIWSTDAHNDVDGESNTDGNGNGNSDNTERT